MQFKYIVTGIGNLLLRKMSVVDKNRRILDVTKGVTEKSNGNNFPFILHI